MLCKGKKEIFWQIGKWDIGFFKMIVWLPFAKKYK